MPRTIFLFAVILPLACLSAQTINIPASVSITGTATVGTMVLPATPISRVLIGQAGAASVGGFFNMIPVAGPQFGTAFQITGATSGSPSYKVALYSAAESGAAGDSIYAANFVAQWDSGHTAPTNGINGVEVDVNNEAVDCVAASSANCMFGINIISGGSNHTKSAILLGSSLPGGTWRFGLEIPSGTVDNAIRIGGSGGLNIDASGNPSWGGTATFTATTNFVINSGANMFFQQSGLGLVDFSNGAFQIVNSTPKFPALHSTTGTLFLCVSTSGVITSATTCSGT